MHSRMHEELVVQKHNHVLNRAQDLCLDTSGSVALAKSDERAQDVYE